MERRTFILLAAAGFIAMPRAARAQPASKIRKIGVLNALPREAPLPQAFLRGLRDLGYVEGKNIIVEYRSGAYDDFPALADDLVKLRVDVIYAVLEQAALAASKATTTIPIVFAVIGDPVRSGLVASLAHPGGNVTGLTAFGSDLGGKRVELLKELIPRLSRIGVLWNPAPPAKMPDGPQTNRPAQVGLEQTEEAGRALGIQVQSFPVRRPSDFSDALQAAARERIGALIVEENSLTYSERNRIIELAAAHQLPAIYGYRDYVVSGGLISYGANLPALMHRALDYIDKILKGAKPSDLPVEQPTKFELVCHGYLGRSRRDWIRCQPRPSGWQCHGTQFTFHRVVGQTGWIAQGACPHPLPRGRSFGPRQSSEHSRAARGRDRCPRIGVAASDCRSSRGEGS